MRRVNANTPICIEIAVVSEYKLTSEFVTGSFYCLYDSARSLNEIFHQNGMLNRNTI